MSLTFYIVSTLPLVAMVAIAFLTPHAGAKREPTARRDEATRATPGRARPASSAPPRGADAA